MTEDMDIRKAEIGDTKLVFKVVNDAYKVIVGDTGEAFKTVNRFQSEDEVEKMLNILFIGESQGEVVGVVGAVVTGNVVDIGPLAVSTGCQKMGIGRKLLDFAESQGDICNVHCCSLRLSNIAMYARRGYKQIKEVPGVEVLPLNILTRTDFTIKYFQKK